MGLGQTKTKTGMDHTSSNDPEGACPAFMIVGTGRCGSTLLQAMLISHSEIMIPHESKFFFDFDPMALGFEDPLPEREVAAYLGMIMDRNDGLVVPHEMNMLDAFSDEVLSGMQDAATMFGWMLGRGCRDQSGRVVGEKTPGHWMKIERAIEVCPGCKVIHLVRDPRDVCEALMRMEWWPWDSVHETARYCARTMRACMLWDDRLGESRHLIVRYEDLIEEPARELQAICSFLGLSYEEQMVEHQSSAAETFRLDREPYKASASEPIDPSRVGRYRSLLSSSSIRLIESIVGVRMMRRFGYAPDSTRTDRVLAAGEKVWHRAARFVHKQINSVRRRL